VRVYVAGYAHPVPPRRDIDRLQQIEELFADLWQVPLYSGLRAGLRPPIDCFRTEDPPTLTVVAELAGVDPASIVIDVAEHQLTISGERPRPAGPSRVFQQMEIDYGSFERHVPLADPVDVDGVAAVLESGMLTITLPLAEAGIVVRHVTIVVRSGP